MNNFCKFTTFLTVVGLGASVLMADKPSRQLAGNPIQVPPVKVAGIKKNANGFQQTTPWMEYGQGGTAQTICQTSFCFDNFEVDGAAVGAQFPFPVDGAANGGCDPDCGLGSARWYFGTAYCNMYYTNDMTTVSGCEGAASERLSFAWYWTVGGVGTSEPCLIAVFTAEDFDDTCVGPDATNYYSGVIYSFGVLPSGGYYFTDIPDLCDFGLFHQLPLDGSGAYTVILANAFDGQTLFLATCAQPMLWGTKGCRGSQGAIQWDDDAPIDGVHTAPGECYDYTYGVCPDPLGGAMLFYGPGGDCCPADTNCDGVVDFFDIDPGIADILNGTSGCSACASDVNQDGVVDFFDIDPLIAAILNGTCLP